MLRVPKVLYITSPLPSDKEWMRRTKTALYILQNSRLKKRKWVEQPHETLENMTNRYVDWGFKDEITRRAMLDFLRICDVGSIGNIRLADWGYKPPDKPCDFHLLVENEGNRTQRAPVYFRHQISSTNVGRKNETYLADIDDICANWVCVGVKHGDFYEGIAGKRSLIEVRLASSDDWKASFSLR